MSSRNAFFSGLLGVTGLVVACLPAQGATVALYEAGGAAAFSPELYGWRPFDIAGPADPQARGVVDTVGGAGAAWQIADAQVGGTAPQYYLPLTGAALAESRTRGWRMTAHARLVIPSLAAPSMGLGVYFDNAAYLLQIDLDGGDLYASLWDNNNPASILSERLTGGADALAYHDYELRWSSATRLATLYFDGRAVVDWDGVPTAHTGLGNLFQFGASTTGGSGVMNFRRVEFETIAAPTSEGDYNQDGAVDAADYSVWRDNLGARLSAADGNGDGLVNQADYVVWRTNFGGGAIAGENAFGAAGEAVPEPASLAALSGLFAAFRCRRQGGPHRDHERGALKPAPRLTS